MVATLYSIDIFIHKTKLSHTLHFINNTWTYSVFLLMFSHIPESLALLWLPSHRYALSACDYDYEIFVRLKDALSLSFVDAHNQITNRVFKIYLLFSSTHVSRKFSIIFWYVKKSNRKSPCQKVQFRHKMSESVILAVEVLLFPVSQSSYLTKRPGLPACLCQPATILPVSTYLPPSVRLPTPRLRRDLVVRRSSILKTVEKFIISSVWAII